MSDFGQIYEENGKVVYTGTLSEGYDDTLISAIESRTSSPVRILRNEAFESNIKGVYPCGEGAGYAGGITSAAMDGIRVAEAIAAKYKPFEEKTQNE